MGRLTPIVQGTPEWFAARRGMCTASEFKKALARDRTKGENTWGQTALDYAMKIAAERMGGEDDPVTTEDMRRGSSLEGEALDAYEGYMMTTVRRRLFFVHDDLPIGYSPDGLVADKDGEGIIEVKCLKLAGHAECWLKQEPPLEYWPQIQGNLWGTGANYCDFIAYNPSVREDRRLCIIRVGRKEQFILDMAMRLKQFCDKVDEFAVRLGVVGWAPYHTTLQPEKEPVKSL